METFPGSVPIKFQSVIKCIDLADSEFDNTARVWLMIRWVRQVNVEEQVSEEEIDPLRSGLDDHRINGLPLSFLQIFQ